MPLTKLAFSSYKYTFNSILQKKDGIGRGNETLQWCALSCKRHTTSITATQRHCGFFAMKALRCCSWSSCTCVWATTPAADSAFMIKHWSPLADSIPGVPQAPGIPVQQTVSAVGRLCSPSLQLSWLPCNPSLVAGLWVQWAEHGRDTGKTSANACMRRLCLLLSSLAHNNKGWSGVKTLCNLIIKHR